MTALAQRQSTELVPASVEGGDLPDLTLAANVIDGLVRDADEGILHEFRNQAEARRLYHERTKNEKVANHFVRLKLLAEAGLGALSLNERERRHCDCSDPEKMWRVLAAAHERGALMTVCDELDAAGKTLSTKRLVRAIRVQGWNRVPRAAWLKLVDARADECGKSPRALSRELGIDRHVSTQQNYPALYWRHVRENAKLLEIDIASLPPMPYRKPQPSGSRLNGWLIRERKRTGGKWDKAYSHFRRCLDEFKDLAPNNDRQFDEMYDHFYAIEQFIGKKMAKDRESR